MEAAMKVDQQYTTIGYLLQQEGLSHCHNAERQSAGTFFRGRECLWRGDVGDFHLHAVDQPPAKVPEEAIVIRAG